MIPKDRESEPPCFHEENGLNRTKALISALGDRGKELGLDTLGGFLSGLFLSGAKSGYNAVQDNRMGQEAVIGITSASACWRTMTRRHTNMRRRFRKS